MTLQLKSLRNKHISITIKKATSDSRFFYELLVKSGLPSSDFQQ